MENMNTKINSYKNRPQATLRVPVLYLVTFYASATISFTFLYYNYEFLAYILVLYYYICYIISQAITNKHVILKFLHNSLKYLYKLIKRSAIFKIIVYTFKEILIFLGVTCNNANAITFCLVALLILISLMVSNNKVKHFVKLMFNISILTVFWSFAANLGYNELFILLLANNIIFTCNDWEFKGWTELSHIVDRILLHDKSIGDPRFPENILSSEDSDDSDEDMPDLYSDMLKNVHKLSNWDMDIPGLQDFNNYIKVNGVKYSIDYLDKVYNFKYTYPVEEKPIKRAYVAQDFDKTPLFDHGCNLNWDDYIKLLKIRIYQFTYEYNTLNKAMTYYKQIQQGLHIDESCKIAAENWQKRQIHNTNTRFIEDMVGYYETYKLYNNKFALCKFDMLKYYKPTLKILSDCAPEKIPKCIFWKQDQAFKETQENCTFIQLYLILSSKIVNELGDQNLTHKNFILSLFEIKKWFYKEHEQYINIWNEQQYTPGIGNLMVERLFQYMVHHEFCLEKFKDDAFHVGYLNDKYDYYNEHATNINSILKKTFFSSAPDFSWNKSYPYKGMQPMLFCLMPDSGIEKCNESKTGFIDTRPGINNKFSHSNYLNWTPLIFSEKTPYANKPVLYTYFSYNVHEGFGYEKKIKATNFKNLIYKDKVRLVHTHDLQVEKISKIKGESCDDSVD